MREILYRGKRVDNGEWIEGFYLLNKNKNKEENYIFDGKCSDGVSLDYYDIDKNTLGQFAGRLDKNGNRIFEGDVVKDSAGGIYKVVYDAEYMKFAFDDGIKWGLEGFESLNDFEVIGNAFDNPKLLEE